MSTPPPLPEGPVSITGLTCASCGGSVEVEVGRTTFGCRYCGTPQAVVGRRGTRRLMVLDQIPADRATEAVRTWLKTGIRKEPALKREARLQERFLAWFPFIRARCDVIGCVLGSMRRRVKRGNKWVTVEEPVEQPVSETFDHTMPGAEMSEFGVSRIQLGGDTLLPLDEDRLRKRGMLFRPVLAPDQVGQRLFDEALEEAKARHALSRTLFSWFAGIRKRTDVVFYPLWVYRYSFRNRTYQVLVDAEDGTIAYGKAPGNHLWRAFSLVGSCALACFLGTTFLQAFGGLLRSQGGLTGTAVVGLLLAGIVVSGFRQFRSGGVVEEGTGKPISTREGNPTRSWLNELQRKRF